MTGTSEQQGVFICYSHENKSFVTRLVNDLRAYGIRVWMDEGEMLLGDSLIQKISEGIENMDYVVAIISKASVNSDWVKKELSMAMTKEIKGRRVIVLPLLLEDCDVPLYLQDKLYADFRNETNYELGFQRILQRLDVIPKEILESQYKVYNLQDKSHAGAKRVAANILVDKGLPESHIKRLIPIINEDVKSQAYSRNKIIEQRFGNEPANVVWLFLYDDIEQIPHANWICSTQWIDPTLDSKFRPMILKGNEEIDEIVIKWRGRENLLTGFTKRNTLTKKDYLKLVNQYYPQIKECLEIAITQTRQLESGEISSEEFITEMISIEPSVSNLYLQMGNIGFPPIECQDLDNCLQGAVALLHNVYILFSEKGLRIWPEKNRKLLLKTNIKECIEKCKNYEYELKKIM